MARCTRVDTCSNQAARFRCPRASDNSLARKRARHQAVSGVCVPAPCSALSVAWFAAVPCRALLLFAKMSQKDVDGLKQHFNDTMEWLKREASKAERSFNYNADQAAKSTRSFVSWGLNQAGHARTQSEVREAK